MRPKKEWDRAFTRYSVGISEQAFQQKHRAELMLFQVFPE